MLITKGSTFTVVHSRKGTFRGEACEDFDADTVVWYPVIVAQDQGVFGVSNAWFPGETIPCRAKLCLIKDIEVPK